MTVLGEAWVNIGANTAPLTAGINGAKAQVSQATIAMQKQLRTLGMGMTIVGAIGVAAFGLTVKSAIAFQKELAQVSTMLDQGTMHYMNEYKSGLQDLSMQFGEATSTLSDGLYDILSASIEPSKALDVLAEAAKAAVAGVTDTGVAADAITTILNSYGMAAEDAGKVSDQLFAIVKRGKLTFAELAPSIGKVAATASKTGLSFEELGASIATITRAGIRTDEAMTSINGILRGFLKPTTEATKVAMDEFGVTLDTNTIKTEGLIGVMNKLKDATAEQLAQMFPNIRGLKGIISAMGDLTGYTKDYALMLDSAGLTQAAFEKQSATVAFKLDQLKKTIGVLAVRIGDVLIPAVSDMVVWMGKIFTSMADWTEAHKPLVNALVKLGAALSVFTMAGGLLILANLYFGHLKIALVGMASTIKMIIPAIGKLSTAWASFGAVSVATNTTIAGGTLPLLSKLGLAVMKFPGPIGLFVIAISGLVLAFKKWQEHSDKTREANERLKASLMTEDEIRDRIGIISKVIENAKSQLAGDEFTFAGSDIMRKQIKDLTIELDVLYDKIKDGKEFIDPFAQSFSDKMLMMKAAVENLEAAMGTIVTNTKDLTSEIDLLTKEQAAYGTTVEANVGYYKQLLEKYNAIDVVLKTELISLKEGTDAWKEKKAEIYDNITALNTVQKSLDELDKPLVGLDLVNAQLALMGDKVEELPTKLELLRQRSALLKEEWDKLKPQTSGWYEAEQMWKDNRDAIDELILSMDLIPEKMASLDNSVLDSQIKLGLLGEEAKGLKKHLAGMIPGDVGWDEWNKKIADNIQSMKELKDSMRDTELSSLESLLGYVRNQFEEGKPSIQGYKNEIGILEKELGLLKDKLDETKPTDSGYYELKTDIEETEGKIKLLNTAVDDTVAGKEPAVTALNEMGVSFTGVATNANLAATAIRNYNEAQKEAIIEAEAEIKKVIEPTAAPKRPAQRILNKEGTMVGMTNVGLSQEQKEAGLYLEDFINKQAEASQKQGQINTDIQTAASGQKAIAEGQGQVVTAMDAVATKQQEVAAKQVEMINEEQTLVETLGLAYQSMAENVTVFLQNKTAALKNAVNSALIELTSEKFAVEGLVGAYETLAASISSLAEAQKELNEASLGEEGEEGPPKTVYGDIVDEGSAGVSTMPNYGEPVLGSFAHGGYIPETGIYKMHAGEEVKKAGQSANEKSITFSPKIEIVVQGDGDESKIKRVIDRALQESARQFSRSGFELVPGRG